MRGGTRRRLLQGSLALAGLGLFGGCGLRRPWQPPTQLPRIGVLRLAQPDDANLEAFRDGLRELGYVDRQTIALEERLAESPDHYAALAMELVSLPVDLIAVLGATPLTQAAMRATRTIPIIFVGAADPVRAGVVASLASPGGNVTGLSSLTPQIQGKRLQLLREIVPGVSRVTLLTDVVASRTTGTIQESEEAAQAIGIQVVTPEIRSATDLPAAFEMAVSSQTQALWVTGAVLVQAERARIVEFARAARLPVLAEDRSFPAAGGLLAYGPDRPAQFRRAAVYIDRILKGAAPGEIPVEQPMTFDFVINLKTAQALGLTIPPSVLQQATEVIQ